MIRKVIYIILLLAGTISVIAGQNLLDYLKASSDGDNITVEWKSIDENAVDYYSLERAGSDQSFSEISTKKAKGFASTYKYIDQTAFKINRDDKTITKNVFYYRLVIHKIDHSTVTSDITSINHSMSSIHRTWGMLKEMFR